MPVSTRVLVCREPLDMRRSFDGLDAAVRERLRENPLNQAWSMDFMSDTVSSGRTLRTLDWGAIC